MILASVNACDDFYFMLRLFDRGWRMLSKMRLQRYNVPCEFAFRLIVVYFFQLLDATLLIQLKVLSQRIPAHTYDLLDLLMG